MRFILNIFYFCLLAVFAPWLWYKILTAGKYRRGLGAKLLGRSLLRDADEPCAWFHGVSVGEIHMLRPLLTMFQHRHPHWDCVISATTDTGFDEARKRSPQSSVFYWPYDFSWAVRSAIRRVNPSLVILAESEIWPNFLLTAHNRGVPVVIANGRMSPRSLANWQRLLVPGACTGRYLPLRPLAFLLRPIVRHALGCVSLWCVQTPEYAARYRALGIPEERIHVTGSIKYDGVHGDRANPRTLAFKELLAVKSDDLIWIAGSTQDPEERLILDIFGRLRADFPALRLFLVPRQKDRFQDVAHLLQKSRLPFVRRSELTEPLTDRSAVVLVDSMGELSGLWGLADVAYVGGSLDGRRGGQNMIEPASFGAAVLFGPHVWNFRDTADRLLMAGAARMVGDAFALETTVRALLSDPAERSRLGSAARQMVALQLGATDRTLDLIGGLLHPAAAKSLAA